MVTSHLIEHVEKLKHFIAIADAGSFAKAANQLHMSQPSLSHTIKVLEGVLSIELFVRSSTGIKLTAAGDYLYHFGKKLIEDTEKVEQALKLRDESYEGRVCIGTKEPYAISLWPKYLKELAPNFPYVEFGLKIARSNAELLKELETNRLEMALLPEPTDSQEMISYELFRDSLALFAAPELKPQQIASLPIYLFQRAICGNGQSVESVLKREGSDFKRFHDVDSYNVAKSIALEGLGVSLLPKSFAQRELENRSLQSVTLSTIDPKAFGTTLVCLTLLRSNSKNRLLRAVLRAIRNLHFVN